MCPDPTAVFFGDAYVNHADHRAVGWATLDAVAPAAALPLYFPDLGPPHQVATVLLTGTLEPDAWVDVGDAVVQRSRSLARLEPWGQVHQARQRREPAEPAAAAADDVDSALDDFPIDLNGSK